MPTNHEIIFEHINNSPIFSAKKFSYKSVIAVAKDILQASQSGLEYATLKFLQQYCITDEETNRVGFFAGDPRKYRYKPELKKNWEFSLKHGNQSKVKLDGGLSIDNAENNHKSGKQINYATRSASESSGGRLICRKFNSEWMKDDYLANTYVSGFVNYIRDLENKKELHHEYKIVDKRWAKALKIANRPANLHIDSLSDAFNEYFWPTQASDEDEKQDLDLSNSNFKCNELVLNGLSESLRAALVRNDSQELFYQCIRVLDWGQVYRGSIRWLVDRFEKNSLCDDIRASIKTLEGDKTSALDAFSSETLRIDSGLTKIFSLASDRSIIYDDRVGAALGLLVRKYLEKYHPGVGVPEQLDFMPGRHKERNPSTGCFKFTGRGNKSINTSICIHSRSNLLANWVVGAIANNLGKPWTIRRVESGLFMIGYRVA